MRRGFDPLAVIVDASEGVDGADDGIGGGLDAVHTLDETAESKPQITVAAGEQASSPCVTINGAAVDFVFAGDIVRRSPFDELGFDFVAIRMRMVQWRS